MRRLHGDNNGFSLTEVLLAIGTIAVGMLFIAGVFPVGIHFNTIASERTIAAVIADEAFAKIRLYGVDFNSWPVPPAVACTDFRNVTYVVVDPCEFSYPSDPNVGISDRQFYWSALCRLPEGNYLPNDPNRLVQVTVFVSRKIGTYSTYPGPPDGGGLPVVWPMPVRVEVSGILGSEMLTVNNPLQKVFINDGYTIVDDENGQIYRVLERDTPPNDAVLRLDRAWNPGSILPDAVWVVPPPINGGRGPCIAIYQRVIRF